MSHEISIRSNGFSEMAFAGQLPWHGLGQRVDENADIETWRTQAGLDWSVESATVEFHAANALQSFADRRVLYRSDTAAPLSVVSDGYRVVQPAEILEFFRDLTQAHGFKIHTAGVLKGGRKIWALARNGHIEEAAPGDKLRGNLLLATSCDGTMATQALWTAIRVVCANTLRIATDGASDAVKTTHRAVFDADETKRELGALDQSFANFAKQAQELARMPVSAVTARHVLNRIFVGTGKAKPGEINAPKEHRAIGKVMSLFDGAGIGAMHAGSAGTAWGLVNAVSEYVDHHQGRSDDGRMDSAWFGQGANIKDAIMGECIKLAA